MYMEEFDDMFHIYEDEYANDIYSGVVDRFNDIKEKQKIALIEKYGKVFAEDFDIEAERLLPYLLGIICDHSFNKALKTYVYDAV